MRSRHFGLDAAARFFTRHAVPLLLATTLLELTVCADRTTSPTTRLRQPKHGSNDILGAATEQRLYQQAPLPFTSLFTGGGYLDVAAADFVIPPGAHWRTTRFVVIGVGFPEPPGVSLFQINLFRDDGAGHPGDVVFSSIGSVPTGTVDPCCGGDVFDYERLVQEDLPPGRYWITTRLQDGSQSGPRRFNPQLSFAVGYPGLVGERFPPDWAVAPGAPNNDFAFSV